MPEYGKIDQRLFDLKLAPYKQEQEKATYCNRSVTFWLKRDTCLAEAIGDAAETDG